MTFDLDIKGFEKYLNSKHSYLNDIQMIFKFENGYGASVVKNNGSYGHEQNLWELAVIRWIDDWDLTYDTPITNDVLGHLTNDEVLEALKQIKGLKEKKMLKNRIKIKLETYQDVKALVMMSEGCEQPLFISDGNGLRVSANSLIGALYAMEFGELYLESDDEIPSYLALKFSV